MSDYLSNLWLYVIPRTGDKTVEPDILLPLCPASWLETVRNSRTIMLRKNGATNGEEHEVTMG